MRARLPDAEGYIERDGVRIFYEVFGESVGASGGRPDTILLLPTWSLVHSRFWKAQVPYLARHFRVVTFDGRGNGRSDRPAGPEAYTADHFAADALAVMDATRTREPALLVSLSRGSRWTLLLATEHRERVAGAVFIAPALPMPGLTLPRERQPFNAVLDTDEGWAKFNRHYWLKDYRGFAEFFAGKIFTEPHSTKQIEDFTEWALETTPETLIATYTAPDPITPESVGELAARVRCPVLVIHGDEDAVIPHATGAKLAELTGGTLVTIAGGGHAPEARDPVKVNLLVRDFAERVLSVPAPIPMPIPIPASIPSSVSADAEPGDDAGAPTRSQRPSRRDAGAH